MIVDNDLNRSIFYIESTFNFKIGNNGVHSKNFLYLAHSS